MFSRVSNLFILLALFTLASCNPKVGDLTHAGFPGKAELDKADQYVIGESVGGKLDPTTLAPNSDRYEHNGINYSQAEEGYYRWGKKLHEMGYRDVYYIQDLAPRAFKRKVMDNNYNALTAGFKDARDAASN